MPLLAPQLVPHLVPQPLAQGLEMGTDSGTDSVMEATEVMVHSSEVMEVMGVMAVTEASAMEDSAIADSSRSKSAVWERHLTVRTA